MFQLAKAPLKVKFLVSPKGRLIQKWFDNFRHNIYSSFHGIHVPVMNTRGGGGGGRGEGGLLKVFESLNDS